VCVPTEVRESTSHVGSESVYWENLKHHLMVWDRRCPQLATSEWGQIESNPASTVLHTASMDGTAAEMGEA
jgi:hypothetical protein